MWDEGGTQKIMAELRLEYPVGKEKQTNITSGLIDQQFSGLGERPAECLLYT